MLLTHRRTKAATAVLAPIAFESRRTGGWNLFQVNTNGTVRPTASTGNE
jgi:hypothetical protein